MMFDTMNDFEQPYNLNYPGENEMVQENMRNRDGSLDFQRRDSNMYN
jgi:hypothetical protein